MPTDFRPLSHAVCANLRGKCETVLLHALGAKGQFSINDPAFDRLHLAVYELYVLGYLTRGEDGFTLWRLTEMGMRAAYAVMEQTGRLKSGEVIEVAPTGVTG